VSEDWSTAYLREIEALGEGSELGELYLWPRTPVGPTDLQEVITRRVGASDYDTGDPRSRSSLVIGKLRDLQENEQLGDDFTLLDIACGDAVVLWEVKKAFPRSRCHGLDCNVGLFATHAPAKEEGVRLHPGYLQHLFAHALPEGRRFDVTVMLNTYRGWESADLREEEQDLPRRADEWLAGSSRFVIVTATTGQIVRLRREGWRVEDLGKGEDESTMICMTEPSHARSGWMRKLTRR
jgi:hypothetical protein